MKKRVVVKEHRVKYIFLDVVGFTRERSVDDQAVVIAALNAIVLKALESKKIGKGPMTRRLLPTGDGLCICLLRTPDYDTHIRIAIDILKRIDEHNKKARTGEGHRFEVRIGMNVNQDILVNDINGHPNVAGDGINDAQRIMNAAEAGHLLLSSDLCNEVMNRERYKGKFAEGYIDVKHGRELHVYQYIDSSCRGINCTSPDRLKSQRGSTVNSAPLPAVTPPPNAKRQWRILGSDWRVLPNKDTPQHTSFKEINLNGELLSAFSCTLHIACEYVRFGVKLLPLGSDVFGAKGIRTGDGLLLHLGKEVNSTMISTSCYDGLVHRNKRKHLLQWVKGYPVRFELTMQTNDTLAFHMNGVLACTVPCSPLKRQRLVMMAWGDGHPYYEMNVKEIRVATTKA